jgi:hypothetical protein
VSEAAVEEDLDVFEDLGPQVRLGRPGAIRPRPPGRPMRMRQRRISLVLLPSAVRRAT